MLSSFHLNSHTLLFHSQTQKLEPACTAYVKVLIFMLYQVVLTYEYANESVAIQVKATEQFRIQVHTFISWNTL